MSKRAPLLVLDTNVWLDEGIRWRKRHDDAVALFEYAQTHDVELAFAMTSVKDVYYLAADALKKILLAEGKQVTEEYAQACNDVAWNMAEDMTKVATPIALDLTDLWFARKIREIHNDLEDNLVIAAAERANADYIVTSDKALLANPHVKAMTAADMLEHFKLFG